MREPSGEMRGFATHWNEYRSVSAIGRRSAAEVETAIARRVNRPARFIAVFYRGGVRSWEDRNVVRRSKRYLRDSISPVVRSVVRPNQNQRLGHFADWGALRYNENHSGARPARRHKRCKSFRHGPLVVAYENSDLRCRRAQNGLIIKIVQTGCLRSLKIDTRLVAQGGVNDDPLQVAVRLKTNAQCFARSCEASWRRAR